MLIGLLICSLFGGGHANSKSAEPTALLKRFCSFYNGLKPVATKSNRGYASAKLNIEL